MEAIMKKILVLLLILTLVLSLASCKKCKEHIDADDDYLCDNCGENFDDGDENPDPPVPQGHKVTFTVKLDDGTPVPGVKFTLHRGETVYATLVSGADGRVEVTLENLAYSVDFDYDSLPELCIPDVFGLKIEEGKDAYEIIIVDNTPNGSMEKPFVVVENETPITLGAGETVYYHYRGSSTRFLSVDNAGITVGYNGESYVFNQGDEPLLISPEIGESTYLSLTNTTDSELSFTLSMIAPLGSSDNPIVLTENAATATVNCETIVFYSFTVTTSGTLTLTSDDERSSISITKVLENDVPVISQTEGTIPATMEVAEGDVITIGVSALEGGKNDPFDVEISFTISITE